MALFHLPTAGVMVCVSTPSHQCHSVLISQSWYFVIRYLLIPQASACETFLEIFMMVLFFQACADIKGSESTMEEVQCAAQWKEGSTFYFLGLLNHSHVLPTDYENRFRCFAYQNIYEGFLVSQSGEAVCTLYSAKEGDRTMTLKKGEN